MDSTEPPGAPALRAAVMELGDVTYVTRYHRNYQVMKELGFEVESFSVRPLNTPDDALFPGVAVDGRLRRFRGRLFAPLRRLEITLRFMWAVWRFRPDILFAHNLPTLIVARLLCLLSAYRRPLLMYDAMELESHRNAVIVNYIPFVSRHWQRKVLERWCVRRAQIVTSADYGRTEVMRQQLGRDDILTCRNIPRYRRVARGRRFHERLGLPADAFVFLYQGVLLNGRGLEVAIRSLASVTPRVVFVIMGPGPETYKQALRDLAQSLGVADRVYLLPPVPSKELLDWTASADAIHSIIENVCLSYYLAAPNKFYEAAMAGVPVVASRFPEMESVLSTYPYGLMVDPERSDQIAEALERLASDSALWNRCRQVAFQAVEKELQWEIESLRLKRRVAQLVESRFHRNVSLEEPAS